MERCYVNGCESPAIFTLKNGKKCCSKTYNKCHTSREQARERRIRTNQTKPSPATVKGFVQPKKTCPDCGKAFSVGNFTKHVSICGKPKSQCIVCGNAVYSYNKTCSSKCHKISISDARHKHIETNGIKTLGYYFYLKGSEIILLDSSYELHACLILDAWKLKGIIEDWIKNTTEFVNYFDNSGKKHKYFPDFKVTNINQSIKWIETKGFQTIIDGIKWNAARDAGMDLDVWFDEDIEKYRKSVLDNLSEYTDNKD